MSLFYTNAVTRSKMKSSLGFPLKYFYQKKKRRIGVRRGKHGKNLNIIVKSR